MSQSGIPVVSQIGAAAGAIGKAFVNPIGTVSDIGHGLFDKGGMLNPAPADPAAPSPTPNPTSAAPAIADAEADVDRRAGRGEAGNILAGASYETPATIARNVLLGE